MRSCSGVSSPPLSSILPEVVSDCLKSSLPLSSDSDSGGGGGNIPHRQRECGAMFTTVTEIGEGEGEREGTDTPTDGQTGGERGRPTSRQPNRSNFYH